MKLILNKKRYKINRLKKNYKTTDLFFICSSVCNQILNNFFVKITKLSSKIFKICLNNSVNNLLTDQLVVGSVFSVKFYLLTKKLVFSNFFSNYNCFFVTAVKFNSKIYSFEKFSNVLSVNYYNSKKVLFQFLISISKKVIFRNNVI